MKHDAARMSAPARGTQFEREIRERPVVWEGIAASDRAARLARVLAGRVVLVGSGSSLFVAQLGALALRRRKIDAVALASTEARLDHNAYEDVTVVAISQSGRSADVLEAIRVLRPRTLVAPTNTPNSPLAAQADVALDVGAGIENAVPASKSVSATVAILLWAASLAGGDGRRDGATLQRAARAIADWLAGPDVAILAAHATRLAKSGSVVGIVDTDARAIVERPLVEVAAARPLRFTIGSPPLAGIERLGPELEVPFNTLGWLVAAQTVALFAARARDIDSDAPRGLRKALAGHA